MVSASIRQFTGLLAAALVAAIVAPGGVGAQNDEATLCLFEARVDQYLQLRRQVEARSPRFTITEDPVVLFETRAALASGIRRERAGARQGELFTAEVAALFRRVIARTLRDNQIDMFAILAEEEQVPIDVRVNGEYPGAGPVSFMPPPLLRALPRLPAELEYRFAGADLILWDVQAGLIVDFVPRALRVLT